MSCKNHVKHSILEITEAQFKDIERRQLDAVEWGKECFGIIRVPLFRSSAILLSYDMGCMISIISGVYHMFHI